MTKLVLVALLCSLMLPSCVRVKAHQRGVLSKRSMTNDLGSGEARFKGHERGAREGADGGNNQPGGGCGCN